MFGRTALVWLVLAQVAITGCGKQLKKPNATDGQSSRKISVVATVGMVADLVRNVGRDHVQVRQLMSSRVDPHLYVVLRDDIQAISGADIVFYSGLMLEGKMADTLEKIGKTKKVLAVTNSLDRNALFAPTGMEGHFDPHVWMDVSLWSQCLPEIVRALSELDPAHATEFTANALQYESQLKELNAYGIKVIGSIPEAQRILVTSHDAFHYMGRAYGLEVLGIQGLSTESEAGLRRINELVDILVSRKVTAVFVESSVSSRNIEALVEGARSYGHSVQVGGELFSDAMGEQGQYTGTYLGMMDHNLTVIALALGGTAPERGLLGKLELRTPPIE